MTNLYEFRMGEKLYQTVDEFAYITTIMYGPHSYNGYRMPYEARTAA